MELDNKKLKVCISSKIINGPYGGGNLFVINLKKYLMAKGHNVVHTLEDSDIDIILLINPLFDSATYTFSYLQAYNYSKHINPKSRIILRVNECDERKNTKNVNKQISNAIRFADRTIFVSNWLKSLYENKKISSENSDVIMSGSDSNIFFSAKQKMTNNNYPINLVTHHWSDHWNKGFEIYNKIDLLLNDPDWNSKFTFTYIGKLSQKTYFKNIKMLKPMTGNDLGKELRKYDGYLTASINEPSGNHHIEAAQCGLPILYLDSGGVPEYCNNYGLMFNNQNFENKLKDFIRNIESYSKNMKSYPYTSNKMCAEYLETFQNILLQQERGLIHEYSKSYVNLLDLIFLSKRFIFLIIDKFKFFTKSRLNNA